jgi:hypothetical protein
MALTLRDFIDTLEDLADEHGTDTEVRLAFQPTWPFEHSIGGIEAVTLREDGGKTPVVYIGEGRQLGYLPGAAAVALGWQEPSDDDDDEDDDVLDPNESGR